MGPCVSVVRVTGGRGGKGGYTGAPVTFATQTQVMFTTQAFTP